MRHKSLEMERNILAAVGLLLALFLLIPLFALVVTTTFSDLQVGLRHPLVWPSLQLSILTTSLCLLIVVILGTPLAWFLANKKGRFIEILETLIQLPILIPPAVAGVAMLLAFGRQGILAGWLYPKDWSVTFTTTAVVLAQIFVSGPLFVQAVTSAFRRIDRKIFVVARTFGASPQRVFLRIAIPMCMPAIVAGAAMSWARSLGEFGATLMFAGNMEGKTQTLPLAIYTAMESDLRAAKAMSIGLVVVAFAVLLFVKIIFKRYEAAKEHQ